MSNTIALEAQPEKQSIKVRVQAFGRFLSGMVMPNIGAFIAWGIITALFIPTGWSPSEELSKLVGPMITYLLPTLIGYTGGKLVGGERGGVVGAIATSGVIIGTSIPMFMGAMIAGPVGGMAIKKFDRAVEGRVKAGFEMLVNNFSAGIIGMVLALVFFKVIGPAVEVVNVALGNGVHFLVEAKLLPLTSVIVEPAKILFLNNAINHGVFSPLGIQESSELGKSIFFMIETNPGPGLGILLAYMLFGKGMAKNTAPGAAIIHFFGGIHEIYFPYVLMQPLLLLAAIAGGMAGVFTNVVFAGGLIAPPSPGSIFAILAMTPKGGFTPIVLSVIVATVVSGLVAMIILKNTSSEKDLDSASEEMKSMKNKKQTGSVKVSGNVSKIIVACDAGMGSSAMGASLLRKKVKKAGLNIEVKNTPIDKLTEDIDIVITHRDLTPRARKVVSNPVHMSLNNFIDGEFYDGLVAQLVKGNKVQGTIAEVEAESVKEAVSDGEILKITGITVGLTPVSKDEAIKTLGKQMADMGYVEERYYEFMLERERTSTTFIGNSVAIPHGTLEGKSQVKRSGIVIHQYPQGIDFGNGNVANLLIGIAGKNDEHVDIISNIADVIEEKEVVEKLFVTSDKEEIYRNFIA